MWSLLPGFCREPRDVPVSFPGLARILGTSSQQAARTKSYHSNFTENSWLILAETEVRKRGREGGERESDPLPLLEEDRAVLSRFSKNYLPILFNLYAGEEEEEKEREGERQAVLQCVQAYVSITETHLITSLSDMAMSKTLDPDLTKDKEVGLHLSTPSLLPPPSSLLHASRHRLLDLVAAMVVHLPHTSLQRLLETISPLLDVCLPPSSLPPSLPLSLSLSECRWYTAEEELSSVGAANVV